MVVSIIKFGIRQTEAVTVGAVRLGWHVARTVVGTVVDVATAGRGHEASETVSAQPAENVRAEPPPEPAPTADDLAEPAPPSAEPAADSAPDRDPERERRIAMRDQPPGDGEQSPHHVLNNPVTDDPDPTEWPDPYEQREDPRDPAPDEFVLPGDVPHTPTGSQSTSSPHPSQDPEAEGWNGPKRSATSE